MPHDPHAQPIPGPPPGSSPHGAPADTVHHELERQLRSLLHEMGGLIEGSLASVRLAGRELRAIEDASPALGAPLSRIEAAEDALGQTAELFRAFRAEADTRTPGRSLPMPTRPLRAAITHAVDLMRPAAEERDITITASIDPLLDRVQPSPLHVVALNAVRNAIESIGRGGEIGVSATVDARAGGGEQVVLRVTDSGPCPDPDALEHAFDAGFTTKTAHSGLGLSIIREIMQSLDGGAWLEPASTDGRGVRFVATHPVDRPRRSAAP